MPFSPQPFITLYAALLRAALALVHWRTPSEWAYIGLAALAGLLFMAVAALPFGRKRPAGPTR